LVNWLPEQLFVLGRSRRLYQGYQEQIAQCDQETEKLLSAFTPRVDPDQTPLPPDRKRN
jgi:hypothetical protein